MAYGLYLHIPFCRSRCRYCDFYTNPGSTAVPETYIDALLRDFSRFAPKTADASLESPRTVYFGGGTPGLLSPAQVVRVLEVVRPAADAEITLEANPGQLTLEALVGWRRAGVNRLSLGVQTARDESLALLGRTHRAEDARQALRLAKKAGFENVSGDVMLALPGYTRAAFDETLALLIEGGVNHISAYMLKIEPGSAFGRHTPAGLPSDDEAADFYTYAAEEMEKAGFTQYEISSFAQPGHEGRHNMIYWNCEDYLGLGPAAHGCLAGRRFSFPPDANAFLQNALPKQDEGPLEAEDYIMLRLRLAAGLNEEELHSRFGVGLMTQQIRLLQTLAAQTLAAKTEQGWRLTRAGLLVQNSILSALFAAGQD